MKRWLEKGYPPESHPLVEMMTERRGEEAAREYARLLAEEAPLQPPPPPRPAV